MEHVEQDRTIQARNRRCNKIQDVVEANLIRDLHNLGHSRLSLANVVKIVSNALLKTKLGLNNKALCREII